MDCIFCKIRDKEIPATLVFEDEAVMVFPDIHPVKPIHLLIVPKKHVSEFLVVDDHALFAKLGKVIQQMITEKNLQQSGYRITINGGGLQDVDHLHMHLMGPMKA